MNAFTLDSTPPRPRWLLGVVTAVFLLGLVWHGAIPQWPDYHDFADTRPWLGIPNAANVLSNLPFAVIGAWGLWRLTYRHARQPAAGADGVWWLFCGALVCTAAGSALYHWAPDNSTLAIDRLPIAWACALLLCAFLAERVHPRWSIPVSLAAALGLATASVLHWWWSERHGQGDLRAYLFVQFLPMLIVPAALGLRLPILRSDAVPGATWCLVLGLYAAAKGMEMADRWMFETTQVASGHMLKHGLAAAAAVCLVIAVVRRRDRFGH